MKDILLLHGAAGAKTQMLSLQAALQKNFVVHTFNFSGHGGTETLYPFTIQKFAEEVHHWQRKNHLEKISIFGYSMGGFVVAYYAKAYPELVDNIITLATKWTWTEAIAAKETALLNPQTIEQKVPRFADALAKLHHPADWKLVLQNTATMLEEMGKTNPLTSEDFKSIHTRTLLLLGDRDKMVTLAETVTVFQSLPSAQLGVLPNTAHPIEGVDVELLAMNITKFIYPAV